MIFINYRQDDTKTEVTHLYRSLLTRYGKDQLFVSWDSIPVGAMWPDHLRQALQQSRVLLAVIGKQWGSVSLSSGKNAHVPRLFDAEDWVRVEICSAMDRQIPVLVLLIDDANLPETDWRCEQLNRLHKVQSLRIRHQRDFEHDFQTLCQRLDQLLNLPSPPSVGPTFVEASAGHAALQSVHRLLERIAMEENIIAFWPGLHYAEPMVSANWQTAMHAALNALPAKVRGAGVELLLPRQATIDTTDRALLLCALQYFLTNSQLDSNTVGALFDTIIPVLNEADTLTYRAHTHLIRAVAALAQTDSAPRLRKRLVDGFIQNRGEQRHYIGVTLSSHFYGQTPPTAANADAIVHASLRGLAAGSQAERVDAALELMNACFWAGGTLGFLRSTQQQALLQALFEQLHGDDASATAALWALAWLTGARNRSPTWHAPNGTTDASITLEAASCAQLARLIQANALDINALTNACLVLNRQRGLHLVMHQADWVYTLATIADGNLPQHALPRVTITGWQGQAAPMIALLRSNLPMRYAGQIALALGALGVFVPEMIAPLGQRFFNFKLSDGERDEAMVYLAHIGTNEAAGWLVKAADTVPPSAKDDYLYTRGLFGLLYLGAPLILVNQINKAAPHSDLNAYAFGLASCGDALAQGHLRVLAQSPNAHVRTAANKALTHKWPAAGKHNAKSGGFWETLKRLI